MNVTIVREDGVVVVDGVRASVDTSDIPTYVRAIQWSGATGWVEFERDQNGVQAPNQPISDLGPYDVYVDRHRLAVTEATTRELSRLVTEAERREADQKALEEHAARMREVQEAATAAADAAAREKAEAAEKIEKLERQNAAMLARLEALEAGRAVS